MHAEHCQNNCIILTPDTSLSIAFKKDVVYMHAEHCQNNCIILTPDTSLSIAFKKMWYTCMLNITKITV